MRNFFSPARADGTKHPSYCAQAADCFAEVEAIQENRTSELDRRHFERSKRDTARARVAAFAGGVSALAMTALGTVAVVDALSGRIQELVTIFGVPFWGLTSIYFMKLSRQYGDALLYLGEHDRIRARDAEEAAELLCQSMAHMRHSYIELYRGYRALLAAGTAERFDQGADLSAEGNVIFMVPPSRRDN